MKIAILTLGCKVNQYESDSIAHALKERGHEVVFGVENADVFIVNTCAVTNEAEKKSRQMISKVQKISPKAKILVCGCASEKSVDSFLKNKKVSFVSGVANKLKLVEKIEEEGQAFEVDELPLEYNDNYISNPSKTRAHIKIQDGCNNFCSYCIIPYLRGRSRSRNVVEILNEIEVLSKSAKEIVLTGIDISDYKIDGQPALGKLLKMLSNNPIRIRLGSLEQGVINEEFLEIASEMKNLCPHFHLSLQSGSKTVLKRMNRHYTPDEFYQTVLKLREIFVNPAITTDVIVGFPGETEEEFNETVEFVKKVGFSSIHIFPYSKRDGTVASRMKDLNGEIKKQRAETLEKVNKQLKKNYIKLSKKTPHSVLIEEKIGKFFVGHSENYIKCYIKAKNLETNTFVNVKIKKKFEDGAFSKIVKIKGEKRK